MRLIDTITDFFPLFIFKSMTDELLGLHFLAIFWKWLHDFFLGSIPLRVKASCNEHQKFILCLRVIYS